MADWQQTGAEMGDVTLRFASWSMEFKRDKRSLLLSGEFKNVFQTILGFLVVYISSNDL